MVSELEAHRANRAASLEAAIVARRYYIDDMQKSEIADEFGISRFKVARLLEEARASGIVRIYVDMPTEVDLPLGEQLAHVSNIKRAIVVRAADESAQSVPALIGAAVADYLRSIVSSKDVLGISWGSTLTSVVDAVPSLASADIVQLVGGVRAGSMQVSGVELVRRLSEKTGSNAFPLHAPLLVRTAEMASNLRNDPALAETIERFRQLTVALVGVGSWDPPKSSLFSEFTPDERRSLLEAGAVADVCTIVLDADGVPIQSAALERAIGITVDELGAVPEVIAVAYGIDKVRALRAVLRSGIVKTVVTDSRTAEQLIAESRPALKQG